MALRTACLALCALTSLVSANTITAKREDLKACLASAKVPFDTKGSETWDKNIRPYNLRLAYTPAAVAIPTEKSQIKAAVSCGIRHSLRVTAKGGGHSYASFGYGGENGHLVIILDRLFKVTLSGETAKIESGARLGHVDVEIWNQGKRALAHGTYPGVGIAGHALLGGYGMASHTYGLTLDWLVGATVVLADATEVHCSATENADLFWALRGAGPSFGIVAEFEFKTFAPPALVTAYTIELRWNREQAVAGLKAFRDFALDAPKELNVEIVLGADRQTVHGAFYGDRAGMEAALKPFLDAVGAKISTTETMDWFESLQYWAGADQPLDLTGPSTSHSTFYTTGLMTKVLTDVQIESFVKALFDNIEAPNARHTWYILLDVHGGKNSAVAAVSPSSTSYYHRDKVFLFQISDGVDSGSYPPEGIALLKGFRESITETIQDGEWGMYTNFVDSELDSETAQKLYWGGNLGKLQSIKGAVDPDNVFAYPQGVRPV